MLGLWLGTSPVHSSVLLHNKDIFCNFSSLLVNLGHFQLTSTISTTVLLVQLVVINSSAARGGKGLNFTPSPILGAHF